MLTALLFLSAFLIESIGTFVSVIGLSSLFSSNPIIIALAVALDIGKLVSVSFLYKHWLKINVLMKTYMTAAAVVLILITSAGAFGFLSSEFQKAMSSTNQQNVILQALTEEQARLQKRKEEIDKQIAQLPETSVRGRTQLMNQFGPEVKRINDRLAAIDEKLPALKVDSIKKNVEVGPIMYIADAFSTTPEKASKWVILIIIFVFDPLAIALLLAGNFLLMEKQNAPVIRDKKDEESSDNKLPDEQPLAPEQKPVTAAIHTDYTDNQQQCNIENLPPLEINELEKELKLDDKIDDKNITEKVEEAPAEPSSVIEFPAIEEHAEKQFTDSTSSEVEESSEQSVKEISRSTLEDIEARKSDVEFISEETTGTRELKNLYSEKTVGVGKTGIPLDRK